MGGAPSKAWAEKLRERELRGEQLTLVQQQAWREALRVEVKHEVAGRQAP